MSDQHESPTRCFQCGKAEVVPTTIEYEASVRHDGRLHSFVIPALQITACRACGEKVFTDDVDEKVNDALRDHLGLLTPQQIRDSIKQIGMSQKDVSTRLGFAPATLSRWLNKAQIQSRTMDNLLRVFFTFPQVRHALSGDTQDSLLRIGSQCEAHPQTLEGSSNHANRTLPKWNCLKPDRPSGSPTFGPSLDPS